MILMLAPAANMNFASLPSGSTYTSDSNGLIRIANGSVADQLALAAAGCQTLSPLAGGAANSQPGTAYAIQQTDEADFILFSASTAVTATLPNNLPVGFTTELFQIGTGQVSAVAASGATIDTPNLASTPVQYSSLLCLVVNNTNGSNAVWVVISQPAQSGSGLIGATTLANLYSQDTSAHYAQYTNANVYSDGTPSNNGVWLKTGSGNGSGNWTQVSTVTLSSVSAAITTETTRATTQEGLLRYPPQSPLAITNAVRRRFSASSELPDQEGDYRSLASWGVRAYRSGNVYNANVYGTFGEPQALQISDLNPVGAGSGLDPVGGYFISVADLNAAGIFPNDVTPPYLSAQVAIDIASAVNCTIDTTPNNTNGQASLILRYGGVGASQELYHQITPNDVWFLNNRTAPSYPTSAMTDPKWVGVYTPTFFTTGNVKGYSWNKIAIPATYNGVALTGVVLIVYGNTVTNGTPSSMQACLASVISGNTIVAGQGYFNPEDKPASFVPEAHVVNTLDIGSADKIIVLGDSLSNGHYQPQNKSWINKVALFSDWNFENFAESGDTLQVMMNRVLTEMFDYGQISFKDYRGSRVVIMAEGNDANWETLPQFIADMKKAVHICRRFGLVPAIASEYRSNFPAGISTVFRSLAEELAIDYIDGSRWGKLFAPASQNGAEFYNLHPGIRANEIESEPFERWLETIEQPSDSFKIFRKRTGFTVSSLDSLVFDSHTDRATAFREIDVGHAAMVTGAVHCDALTAQAANWTINTIRSEYIKARSGEPVAFTDYGLIEARFRKTPDEVRLVLNDPNILVYALDVMASPLPVSANRYQAFTPSGSPSITAGATYTSNDAFFTGVTFTYVGTWNGQAMFTPAVVTGTARGAGILTKVTGTGDTTVGYNTSQIGFDAVYYNAFGLPPGHWAQIIGNNGVYTLQASDLKGKLRRNRVSFLLYEASGFSLSAPRIMWRGSKASAIQPRKTFPYTTPARGAELLTNNYFTTLTGWTVTGSLTPAAPADGQMPQDPKNAGATLTNCVTCDTTDYPSQAFTWTPSYEDDIEVEVTVYQRYFPALADPSPFTSDTFDWPAIEIDIITSGGNIAPWHKKMSTWWGERRFRTVLPLGTSNATLRILPTTANSQVAYASVRIVNA